MQRWIAWVAQHVDEVESRQIKSDIDLFTGMTGRLAGEIGEQERYARAPEYSPQSETAEAVSCERSSEAEGTPEQ